jgi:hypothetical protein
VPIEPIGRFTRPLLEESRRRDFGPLASDFGISGDVAFGSALRTGARHEGVLAAVGAGVGTLQLMEGLTLCRTIAHMNPPAAVPHLTKADT